MKNSLIALVLTLVAVGGGAAAENSSSASSSSTHLGITTDVKTALNVAPLVYSRCDVAGNLYLRLDTADPEKSPSKLPITEMTVNGKLGRVYRLPESPKDLQALEYFASPDGHVHAAAWSSSERAVYLVSFTPEGTASAVRLQSEYFIPRQLVVFNSGEALVSGTLGNAGGRWYTPFTGVFDLNGKLIKKLYEPEDEVSRQKASANEPGFVGAHGAGNRTIWRGDIALGSDGNAYLMRSTSPPLIYVISPRGEILRKLHIASPSAGVEPRWLRASHGKLAVYFVRDERSYDGEISVTDLGGKQVAAYTSFDDGIQPGLPGCYNGDSFTFIWGTQLRTAEPK